MTRDQAQTFAVHWITAWNSHDLDAILALYHDSVELTSPVAAKLLATADGKVTGKADLQDYFRRGLQAFPNLHFHLEDVLWGLNSIVLYYTNHAGTKTAEFMELGPDGKVHGVVAHYSA